MTKREQEVLEEFDEMKKSFISVRLGQWWSTDEDYIKQFILRKLQEE